jgi:hypothetical protein
VTRQLQCCSFPRSRLSSFTHLPTGAYSVRHSAPDFSVRLPWLSEFSSESASECDARGVDRVTRNQGLRRFRIGPACVTRTDARDTGPLEVTLPLHSDVPAGLAALGQADEVASHGNGLRSRRSTCSGYTWGTIRLHALSVYMRVKRILFEGAWLLACATMAACEQSQGDHAGSSGGVPSSAASSTSEQPSSAPADQSPSDRESNSSSNVFGSDSSKNSVGEQTNRASTSSATSEDPSSRASGTAPEQKSPPRDR